IREREEVQEKIDPAVFGNLAHYSLEYLYQGFTNRKGRRLIQKEDFDDLRDNWVSPSVELAIRKHYSLAEHEEVSFSGQLVIARDVLYHYIKRLMEVDKSYVHYELMSIEGSRDYTAENDLVLPQSNFKIGLKKIIDRVDRVGDTVRLIYYMSGSDKKDYP